MTHVFQKAEIIAATETIDVLHWMEQAFIAYSQGNTVIPPVGHLQFTDPPGDTCIKYGYQKGADTFVVKIASGFYLNPKIQLPASTGIMVVFSQKTGVPQAVLLDGGYLTDLRTGAAGAVATKYLAPQNFKTIGIVGTGTQARFQLLALRSITDCRDVLVWGRNEDHQNQYIEDMQSHGFQIRKTRHIEKLCEEARLIISTTPSHEPILLAKHIQPGTHINAIGADAPGKQELDPAIFHRAEIVVADSIAQCIEFGEISHAINTKQLESQRIRELGSLIVKNNVQRGVNDISVADLTGVAIQDVAIATAVTKHLEAS